MAFVPVVEAARLVGRDRKTLYRDYISTGRLSATKNARGRFQIDTNELLRVFGAFVAESPRQDIQPQMETIRHDENLLEKLRVENAALRDKIETQAENLNDLRQALKLLDHKKTTVKWRLWPF